VADNFITVVNRYNNECHEEALKLLMNDKRISNIGKNKYGVHLNKSDKHVDFVWSSKGAKVMRSCDIKFGKNHIRFQKGTLIAPFDIFTLAKCNGNVLLSVQTLLNRFIKKKPPYVRVGYDYYKVIQSKDRQGIIRRDIAKWQRQALKDDYGGDHILDLIPKYDSFGLFPNNIDWKESVGGQYNQYKPFSWKHYDGEVKEEEIKWSLHLIKHIWRDQWELGLVYMQVLYLYPKQILPILALVSSERETGKSTFGDWLNIIFGDNACVINPSNISSDFNSSYSTKNIIIIEETKFDKSSDLEKIKSIATQKKITVNAKFMPEYQIPFYGKVVMMSNHEDRFVRIDEEENRYWVLKVPKIEGKANHNILEDLTNEVPKFLKFLKDLPEPDFTKSRMVFTQKEISTQILDQTKINSRSGVHKDILIYLEKEMMENQSLEFIEFRHEGLHDKYFGRNSRISVSYVQDVIKNEMHLTLEHRTSDVSDILLGVNSKKSQVRCYKIPNKHYDPNSKTNTSGHWLDGDNDNDTPF